MITLSLNFDNLLGGTARNSHEKKIRELIDTHLTFPGSDKLQFGVNIKDNGSSSVSFTGPKDAIAEAKRLWKENVQPTADKLKKAVDRANKQTAKAVKSSNAKLATAVKKAKKEAAAKKTAATKPSKAKVAKAPSRAKATVKAKAKVAKKVVKKKR
jgi:hypothetical protein